MDEPISETRVKGLMYPVRSVILNCNDQSKITYIIDFELHLSLGIPYKIACVLSELVDPHRLISRHRALGVAKDSKCLQADSKV